MKKISSLIFLIFLFCGLGYAQFRISAGTGYISSDIKEILWNKTGKDAQITSLLDWQTYIAPTASVDLEYKFASHFVLGAGGFYTSPFICGIMEDSDYMNIFTTGSKERTHYSKHDNKLNNYFSVNAFLGTGWKLFEQLELTAIVSYKYTYYSFTAWNGWKQYGSNPKTPMQGKIITFEAEKHYLGAGIRSDYSPTQNLLLALNLNVLPTIFCKAFDTHFKRSTPYTYFELKNELALDSSILLEYMVRNNLALSAGFELFVSSVKNGIILQSNNKKEWDKASNPGGIKECTGKFLLGLTFVYEK